jgi:putative mRNA 3-end processing factor
MQLPIDVTMSGTVVLGPTVACDGFLRTVPIRVQTHVHLDHMEGFESSKGVQTLIMSGPTRALLCLDFDADIPYRTNIVPLDCDTPFQDEGVTIRLLENGHMLGAVQVAVELKNGPVVGYSGDFQWPWDRTIEVEHLVVDSTYGAPTSVRNYDQGACEARFLNLVSRCIARGPVIVFAHRGTLHRALMLLTDEISAPIIGTRHLLREVDLFRHYGFPIGELIAADTDQGRDIYRSDRYVRVYGTGDARPSQTPALSTTLKLTAYFSRPDDPIIEYSDRAFGVALSNHADFNGTLEYITATRARNVVTDNSRGKGV